MRRLLVLGVLLWSAAACGGVGAGSSDSGREGDTPFPAKSGHPLVTLTEIGSLYWSCEIERDASGQHSTVRYRSRWKASRRAATQEVSVVADDQSPRRAILQPGGSLSSELVPVEYNGWIVRQAHSPATIRVTLHVSFDRRDDGGCEVPTLDVLRASADH